MKAIMVAVVAENEPAVEVGRYVLPFSSLRAGRSGRILRSKPVNTVFADTFYWAALTGSSDPANVHALNVSRSIATDGIVTTDEVPSEYLTFFADARASIRD